MLKQAYCAQRDVSSKLFQPYGSWTLALSESISRHMRHDAALTALQQRPKLRKGYVLCECLILRISRDRAEFPLFVRYGGLLLEHAMRNPACQYDGHQYQQSTVEDVHQKYELPPPPERPPLLVCQQVGRHSHDSALAQVDLKEDSLPRHHCLCVVHGGRSGWDGD